MEVLGMAGKLLRNISTDKIENRDAEYYKQALDLSPGYSDCGIGDSCSDYRYDTKIPFFKI